jgi:hypothetical protein
MKVPDDPFEPKYLMNLKIHLNQKYLMIRLNRKYLMNLKIHLNQKYLKNLKYRSNLNYLNLKIPEVPDET